jgi:hypothetical protein
VIDDEAPLLPPKGKRGRPTKSRWDEQALDRLNMSSHETMRADDKRYIGAQVDNMKWKVGCLEWS